MDIRTFAVEPTKCLHLRDASDQLMYADVDVIDDEGNKTKGKTRPIAVNLYGPGSKQYAKAKAAQNNRIIEKLKRKGKIEQTAEQSADETAEFLSGCTASWENVEYGKITETNAVSMAVYSDEAIGFIADQVSKELNEWSNFTKPSLTN